MGFTASASAATGKGAGNSTTYSNSQVEGSTVSLSSGGDTNIHGAVVKGHSVTADVGGNPHIQSLQDQARYAEKNQSVGGSVMVGAGGGSFNASQSKINSNFQSVGEQSAIRAGDGGFDVNVKGNTTLTGAQITSTQAAIDNGGNRFQTGGTLTTTDVQNQSRHEAQSVSVGMGASVPSGGALKAGLGGVGVGQDSNSQSSTSTAGISGIAGNTAARTGDAETGLTNTFNQEQVKAEVNAQAAITQEFGRNASKLVGDYAAGKLKEAEANKDQAGMEAWREGGSKRVALHALVGGLTGGVQGAIGSTLASAAAPRIDQLQSQLQQGLQNAGLGDSASQLIASLAGGTTAAAIGGTVGGVAGAGAAFNADMNNRQLHPSERKLANDLADKSKGKYTKEQIEEQMRLMGNDALGAKPNTLATLVGDQIAQSRDGVQDPVPVTVYGTSAIEIAGHYDAEIQKFIMDNTANGEGGWIPGATGYIPSQAPVQQVTTTPPATQGTASCAYLDANCIAGVGQQQNASPSRQSVADAAALVGRSAGLVAASATAISAQSGPYGKPAQAVAVGATGVGFVANVVEQTAKPDTGKGLVDFFGSILQEQLDKRLPIVAPMGNETIEFWKKSSTSTTYQTWVNKQWESFLSKREEKQ